MKKLYELDPSKEFEDVEASSAKTDNAVNNGQFIGDFNVVSGVGVGDVSETEDEATTSNIQEMLSRLNDVSEEALAKAIESDRLAREQYQREEEERFRLAQEKFNRERYEREQEALRLKRIEDEKLEALRLAEEEALKKNTFGFKLKSAFGLQKSEEQEESKEPKPKKEKEPKPKKEKIPKIKKQKSNEEVVKPEIIQPEIAPIKVESKPIQPEVPIPVKLEEIIEEPIIQEEEMIYQEPVSFEDEIDEVEFQTEEDLNHLIPNDSITEEFNQLLEEEMVEAPETPIMDVAPAKSTSKPSLRSIFTKTPTKKVTKNKTQESPVVTTSNDEPDWKWIATHDEMTGLLNTRAYAEDLKQMNGKCGVVFFDINNLKMVNDTYTHEVGNRLILGVTKTIQSVFQTERFYRTGGDEFVILIEKPSRNEEERIDDYSTKIHNALLTLSKQDKDKIPYAVSIGYALGDGKTNVDEIIKAADVAMYRNKQAYKFSHKDWDVRNQEPAKVIEADHDELLTKEQQLLKGKIQNEHAKASKGSTEQIIREIQKRASEIEAVFIASPTFDHLFVISDVGDFLDIMDSKRALIDYSYLYVVYQGGPQYYGADEYYQDVTHLFEDIAEALLTGRFRNDRDVKNIPGINIFKNVYI